MVSPKNFNSGTGPVVPKAEKEKVIKNAREAISSALITRRKLGEQSGLSGNLADERPDFTNLKPKNMESGMPINPKMAKIKLKRK